MLLRGIHCVNIFAAELQRGKGAQSGLFTDKGSGTQRSYLVYSSPLHASAQLISKSNIFVTGKVPRFSFYSNVLTFAVQMSHIHKMHMKTLIVPLRFKEAKKLILHKGSMLAPVNIGTEELSGITDVSGYIN